MARLRKYSEVLSANLIEMGLGPGDKDLPNFNMADTKSPILLPISKRTYNKDTIRVWDFIHTFQNSLGIDEAPKLDAIQNAVNSLGKTSDKIESSLHIKLLNDIAITLCKPLASSIIKLLSSTIPKDSNLNISEEDVLPVNAYTWREVARVALLIDALKELGYSKQDQVHIIRGYRSNNINNPQGHGKMNNKRREDNYSIMLRQALQEDVDGYKRNKKFPVSETKVCLPVPCEPNCSPEDWRFFLHNINSLPTVAVGNIKTNAAKALEVLKNSPKVENKESLIAKIESIISGSKQNIKNEILKLLDEVEVEVYSKEVAGESTFVDIEAIEEEKKKRHQLSNHPKPLVQKKCRSEVGKTFCITLQEYEKAVDAREEYMIAAAQEKEEKEAKEQREKDGELDEDDDEDDDDDDDNDDDANQNGEKQKSEEEKKESNSSSEAQQAGSEELKIGKKTPYDDFCSDDPGSPDSIRRCLAVLRSLSVSAPGELFVYPVDPQAYPRYYESVLRPMCLQDVGRMLKRTDYSLIKPEKVVTNFGRDIRRIGMNVSCFNPPGSAIIATAEQMLRLFERLLFDWVLAPSSELPPLGGLDDDRCVEYHVSDEESLVLLCDRCEGKYNMSRLTPPLSQVPKGDWYCPRCLSGRSWPKLDPRIGKTVQKKLVDDKEILFTGTIRAVFFSSNGSFLYIVQYDDFDEETWSLADIDKALIAAGTPVPPIALQEAIAESLGYFHGRDCGLGSLVPNEVNPCLSAAAAQNMSSSSVFCDTIVSIASLTMNSEEMNAEEWMVLLNLLAVKTTLSEKVQELTTKLENEAAEMFVAGSKRCQERCDIESILPKINYDEVKSDNEMDEEDDTKEEVVETIRSGQKKATVTNIIMDDNLQPTENSGNEKNSSQIDVPVEDIVDKTIPDVKMIEVQAEPVQSSSNIVPITHSSSSNVSILAEATLSPEEAARRDRFLAIESKSFRTRTREEGLVMMSVQEQLQNTFASFEEENLLSLLHSVLPVKNAGFSAESCRSRDLVCDFCKLPDISLGTSLVRVPTKSEWLEIIPHAISGRNTCLFATCESEDDMEMGDLTPDISRSPHKYMGVTIRVGGELISESCSFKFDGLPQRGMLEFIPRNPINAQDEMHFRSSSNLPFLSGSLSAHECCAVFVHNARMEKIIQDYKEQQSSVVEQDCARACGRTLPLGFDKCGRSYWVFNSDKNSLFVHEKDSEALWYRYDDPKNIAKVIYTLGKGEPVEELKRLFPKATMSLLNEETIESLSVVQGEEPIRSGSDHAEDEGQETTSSMVIGDEDVIGDDDDEVCFRKHNYIHNIEHMTID
mmetsp:Transcript_15583/g.35073  ORF Transcript_15583/g.35073 Transcript_15583/m.35073 type:complete len:1317 (-) Transcript_15583:1237-5187(-)